MNKVCLLAVLSRVSGVGVVGCEDECRAFCKKKKKTSVESVGILGLLWQEKPGIVTQVTNNNNTFLRYRHCLVIFSVFILLFQLDFLKIIIMSFLFIFRSFGSGI